MLFARPPVSCRQRCMIMKIFVTQAIEDMFLRNLWMMWAIAIAGVTST